ncbi:MAG: CGNR zinc finger domain-containing protein [Bryobacteraceae bacterium]|jgi:predicted RNA-binding Zn ribbon-like protein
MPVTTWKLIGGRLCLDFVDTVGGRVRTGERRGRDYADAVGRDKLPLYSDLLSWAESAGALTHRESLQFGRRAASDPQAAASVLARAAQLRAALYRIFKSVVERWAPEPAGMRILQRELSAARDRERLAYAAGAFVWTWDGRARALDCMLWPVARSAAELLASNSLAMVRQCAGDECGWMFLDSSRNHKRRWCDVKDCGNRAKVKRFRRRATIGVAPTRPQR